MENKGREFQNHEKEIPYEKGIAFLFDKRLIFIEKEQKPILQYLEKCSAFSYDNGEL
jgi:hypothetical protein